MVTFMCQGLWVTKGKVYGSAWLDMIGVFLLAQVFLFAFVSC